MVTAGSRLIAERLVRSPGAHGQQARDRGDGDDVALICRTAGSCTAGIVGPMYMGAVVIDDGRIEFTAEEPGDYTIWVSAPGRPDWSVVIAAAACAPR